MVRVHASIDENERPWITLCCALLAIAALVYFGAIVHRDRLPATNAATIVSTVSALVSMMLLQRGLRRGPDAIAGAFITSWLLRSAISIGGCVAAIVWLHVAANTTLLTMTLYYFATLAAETWIAVRRLKTTHSPKAL